MKTTTIRLTTDQRAALEMLATMLDISGQREAKLQPLIHEVSDTAKAAMTETAWLLGIARQVAAGGNLAELLEFTPLPAQRPL